MSAGFLQFPRGKTKLPKVAYSKRSLTNSFVVNSFSTPTFYSGSSLSASNTSVTKLLKLNRVFEYSADSAYIDTSQTCKCTADGDMVCALKDTSGKALHLVQAKTTGSPRRPVYDTANPTASGKYGIRFSGAQTLTSYYSAPIELPSFTFYLVVRPTAPWVSGLPAAFVTFGGTNIVGFSTAATQLTVFNSTSGMPSLVLNSTYLISSDSARGNQRIFIKGGPAGGAPDTIYDAMRSGTSSAISGITVGAYSTGYMQGGQIYYLAGYNVVHSTTERIIIQDYLNNFFRIWS